MTYTFLKIKGHSNFWPPANIPVLIIKGPFELPISQNDSSLFIFLSIQRKANHKFIFKFCTGHFLEDPNDTATWKQSTWWVHKKHAKIIAGYVLTLLFWRMLCPVFESTKNKWLSSGQPGYSFWLPVQLFGCPFCRIYHIGLRVYKDSFWLQIYGCLLDNCIIIFGCPATFLVVPGARTTKISNAGCVTSIMYILVMQNYSRICLT